jgi:hypothetical protein
MGSKTRAAVQTRGIKGITPGSTSTRAPPMRVEQADENDVSDDGSSPRSGPRSSPRPGPRPGPRSGPRPSPRPGPRSWSGSGSGSDMHQDNARIDRDVPSFRRSGVRAGVLLTASAMLYFAHRLLQLQYYRRCKADLFRVVLFDRSPMCVHVSSVLGAVELAYHELFKRAAGHAASVLSQGALALWRAAAEASSGC